MGEYLNTLVWTFILVGTFILDLLVIGIIVS